MLQHWSVWRPELGRYDVYASQVAFRHPALGPEKPSLGDVPQIGIAPEDVLPRLPSDAKQLGRSEYPVGRVALSGVDWSGGKWIWPVLLVGAAIWWVWRWE